MGNGSDLGDQHLAAQGFRGGLRQDLPGHGGVALAHLREHRPEVRARGTGLDIRIRHLELRALVARSLRGIELLTGAHFCSQAILGRFDRIRTLGAVEVGHVIRQQIGIRQQQVIGRVVFRSSADDVVSIGELLLHGLQFLHGLGSVLRLGQQGVLHHAGIAIQQRRSFCAEVLQDLKTFAAYALQVLVGAALARGLRLAVGRGVGRRLWEC